MQGNPAYSDCLFTILSYLTNYIKQGILYLAERSSNCLRLPEIPDMGTCPKATHSIICI